MKNLFILTTILFSFLLASCSKEEGMDSTNGNNRVCISPVLSEDGIATRAQIDIAATHKLRCILEVWTKESSPVLMHREEVAIEAGSIPPFEFELKEGDYDCLLWADYIDRGAGTTSVTLGDITYKHFAEMYYNTTDLHQVTILDEKAGNLFDTDLCDAFFAKLPLVKEEGGVNTKLKLTRPFAKLTVKEKSAKKFAELKKMRAIYSIPKGFNVSTGEPMNETINAICEKTFDGKETSQVLFTNYIFAPSVAEGKGLEAMTLSFTTQGKIDCEIAAGSIIIKRNEKVNASGNLMMGGAIDPDPEPEPEPDRDPLVGDYFFIDGTWSAELTDENKDKCVGIVYAVSPQTGDEIANYGAEAAGKTILGYVMALKNIVTGSMGMINNEHGVSGRPYLYRHSGGTVEAGIEFFAPVKADKTNFTGFTKTKDLLSSAQFTGHATDWSYPVLQVLATWKKNLAPATKNASEWYIPSVAQLYAAAGGCYGVESKSGYPAVTKVDALNAAFNAAISSGVAEAFTTNTGAGYYVYTSCLNTQTATGPGPCFVQINKDGSSITPKENDAKGAQGVVRPVLTIIK